ncbi:unnamed protein product [Bursaphelenchus xylophilus]|uniref:(pine wood nematode) hypothetical protein n=1 Tax=Bursaphelenchus xylophilus TaxID=6326 RepID=A0A1I7RPM3_BURXY|nr:unnamed protein product [Bursaphelenchus xylophilus]CAG9096280.1 unnamed protein product [Bursaphelenchus xylophilus]
MANHLQNKQLCTEFSVQLAKVYDALGVKTKDEYDQKLTQLASEDPEIGVKELTEAWNDWENFLVSVDNVVQEVAGPHSPKSVDNIKLGSKEKSKGQSTLLSYVQNSPYNMMFIEVVYSFSSSDCAEHVLKMYEKLPQFQALDCDILLLTKSSGGEGGGFLKLVGVPFRLLLDEEQSLARIIQHRQSAISISGQRAIHLLAEISTDDKLKVGSEDCEEFGQQGGVILLDSEGSVLYHKACDQETDWPKVDELLESVKKKSPKPKSPTPQPQKSGEGSKKERESGDTNVPVAKKKCCVIM